MLYSSPFPPTQSSALSVSYCLPFFLSSFFLADLLTGALSPTPLSHHTHAKQSTCLRCVRPTLSACVCICVCVCAGLWKNPMKSESSRRQPVKSVSCFRDWRSLAYLHGLPALRERKRLSACVCVRLSVCICISASLLTGIFGAWLNRIARRLINIKRGSHLPLACLLPLVEWIRSLCEWIIENIYRVHCSNFKAACNLVCYSAVASLLFSNFLFKLQQDCGILSAALSRFIRLKGGTAEL